MWPPPPPCRGSSCRGRVLSSVRPGKRTLYRYLIKMSVHILIDASDVNDDFLKQLINLNDGEISYN